MRSYRHGAHRSATLMLMMALRSDSCCPTVTTFRDRVDFESTPPQSMACVKPSSFLQACTQLALNPWFLTKDNELVSPLNFRHKALEADVETVNSVPPALNLPSARSALGNPMPPSPSFSMFFPLWRATFPTFSVVLVMQSCSTVSGQVPGMTSICFPLSLFILFPTSLFPSHTLCRL